MTAVHPYAVFASLFAVGCVLAFTAGLAVALLVSTLARRTRADIVSLAAWKDKRRA